ncbi:uncharacterized protein LOC132203822 isoform X4 [Neocloeon triangulifer]|uniref:uncharacterized protein LOC132203822 isoform X4 n=1 Tax=Neocloeon triangulifer TaxID=2078957 RepID=UPI00286F74AA|nr:uncharacterized protein LOC132203822 isoform X4 [Neocloeon triangulifer]
MLFVVAALLLPVLRVQGLNTQADIAGLVGDTMLLPCEIDTGKCGELHSIKWYRGSSRIFVFSEAAKIARAEGEYAGRAELHYTTNMSRSHLEIRQLQLADEAVYKCEITFLEVREGCAVVQFVNLTALIKPEYVKVLKEDGSEISSSTLIGPFQEGQELKLSCQSGGGKPIPDITWWNGTHKLPGAFSADPGPNGVGTGVNRLQVTLGRGDLGAKYECKASSRALSADLTASIEVDVNVRPLRLDLSGVEEHVHEGTEVVLTCQVTGARPAANITWFNGTEPVGRHAAATTHAAVQSDGTYETQSELRFKATRHENGETLTCEATNPVLVEQKERPLKDTVTLEVLYPPSVFVSPENVTVNESTDVLLFCQFDANPAVLNSVQWLRDGKPVVLDGGQHYEGGTPLQTTLLIKNATRVDQGTYSCVLENAVGKAESQNVAYVAIYYKPSVSLVMEPTAGVSETERLNITLVCRVEGGNPASLLAVRWYLDKELLKELPDCGVQVTTPSAAENSTFCDIDPSKLLLESVGRNFHGNYSCEGMNEAGWGPMSDDKELVVFYPPGQATLTYEPARVVKRSSVTLMCSITDLGRPEATSFKWLRGQHPIHEVTSANLTIDPVNLETLSNFTCLAFNEGGEGEGATVFIDVFAPPTFIERLPPYHGALMNAEQVSLSCRIECQPACGVKWLKDGQPIALGLPSSRYTVKTSVLPPDPRTNDFESVVSTLVWDMRQWPNHELDRVHDNANYTCESSATHVGPGVKSTTFFGVEYPPENVSVSVPVLSVVEGHIPEKILCNAKAYPEPSYQWHRENDTEISMKGNALILNYPIPRSKGGNYVCEAFNRHGNITHKTFINVLHKPECAITQREVHGKLVLICNASANPTEVDFTWKIKNENETIEENIETNGLTSMLTLESRVENFRTYLCFANNSVGMSIPCERDITAYQERSNPGWWASLDNDHKLIFASIITGALLMVIVIFIILCIVCRRKRVEDKYNNSVELEERENPEGDTNLESRQTPAAAGEQQQASSAPAAIHRWPLRPGVHVHVNGARNLMVATPTSSTASSTTNFIRASSQYSASGIVGSRKRSVHAREHAKATHTVHPAINNNNPESHPGVVTLKKLDGSTVQVQPTRKRKKPGQGPNQFDIRDRLSQEPSVDGDRQFYENLPFHGIQSPPNKPRALSVEATEGAAATAPGSTPASPAPSRPESPLSRQNSSGYGSTRSKAEQTSLSSSPVKKLSSSNPDLNSEPPAENPPRVEGRRSQREGGAESQTLPRVQGRKTSQPCSVNIIKPLEITREPFVISPPAKAAPPHKTITLQKTEKIVTTVSIQNITNSNYKKPPAPIPPPGRPLLPPCTLPLPKRATSTPKCPVHPNGPVSSPISSSSSSFASSSDSSATSTSTVRQFHSLQRPKSKEGAFYSLRRSNSSETRPLTQRDCVKLACKSTPDIAREAKAPIPTPRSLKASFSFSNPSSPIARVFSKPLYQNVPVRISPNHKQARKDEPLTQHMEQHGPPSRPCSSSGPHVVLQNQRSKSTKNRKSMQFSRHPSTSSSSSSSSLSSSSAFPNNVRNNRTYIPNHIHVPSAPLSGEHYYSGSVTGPQPNHYYPPERNGVHHSRTMPRHPPSYNNRFHYPSPIQPNGVIYDPYSRISQSSQFLPQIHQQNNLHEHHSPVLRADNAADNPPVLKFHGSELVPKASITYIY